MADSGMPFVMTARMKQALRGHGLTDAAIAEMTPGAAHTLITTEAPCFTVIASLTPERLGKRYAVRPDGTLAKTSVATITRGVATTLAATPETLARALAEAAESTNQCLVLNSFIGARPGDPADIRLVSERTLARLTGGEIGDLAPGAPGYFTVGDRIVSARLKRLMAEPRFILIDADNPPGMPPEFAELASTTGSSRSKRSCRESRTAFASSIAAQRQGSSMAAARSGPKRRMPLSKFPILRNSICCETICASSRSARVSAFPRRAFRGSSPARSSAIRI